jgi:peptidyl-prolyl cis-trans isomerase SurA
MAALAFFLSLASPIPAPAATSVDRIVALVNNEVITLSELNAQLNAARKSKGVSLPPGQTLERQVLDSMIELELLNQEARRKSIVISERDVDEDIESFKTENKITDAQLRASLAQSGVSYPDFRAYRRNLLLQQRIIYQKTIVVTEDEVDKFLAGEGPSTSSLYMGGSADSDKVRILFLPSSPDKSGPVMERAMNIKMEVDAGLSFAEAARLYSKGPGAEQGGDTGIKVADLVSELRAVALNMAPGQVSEPLNGGQVVLLLYVEPRSPDSPSEPARSGGTASKPDLAGFSPEQREMARRQLYELKLRDKYKAWLQDQKSKANIKITL